MATPAPGKADGEDDGSGIPGADAQEKPGSLVWLWAVLGIAAVAGAVFAFLKLGGKDKGSQGNKDGKDKV